MRTGKTDVIGLGVTQTLSVGFLSPPHMPVAGIDTAIGESLFLDDQTGHQPDDDPFPTIQYLLPSCLLSTRSMTEMEMRASSYHRSKPIQWWPGSLGLMLSIYFHIMSTGIDDNMERIG